MVHRRDKKTPLYDMISRNNSAASGSRSDSQIRDRSKSMARTKSLAPSGKKSVFGSSKTLSPVYARSTDKKSLVEDHSMSTQSLPAVSTKHDRLMVGKSSSVPRLSNAELQDALVDLYFSFAGSSQAIRRDASLVIEQDIEEIESDEVEPAVQESEAEVQEEEDEDRANTQNIPQSTPVSPMMMVLSTVLVASIAVIQYGPENLAKAQETVRELIEEAKGENESDDNDCNRQSSENPENQGFLRWILSVPFPKYECNHLKRKMRAGKESKNRNDCEKS